MASTLGKEKFTAWRAKALHEREQRILDGTHSKIVMVDDIAEALKKTKLVRGNQFSYHLSKLS
jgi:hypothetical protein